MLNVKTKLFAIIGNPVKHSFSPVMHNAWFKEENLNCAYLAFEPGLKSLKKTIEALKLLGFCAINVTIPFKTEVMKYLDYCDNASKAIGSVNTVVNKNGKLCGYNTDYSGWTADLASKNVEIKDKKVFVFGAGGAARAVLHAVKGAKEAYVANIIPGTAEKLAKEFKVKAAALAQAPEIIKKADLIINASACGMSKSDSLPFKAGCVNKNAVIYDLIYNKVTPFVKLAQKKRVKFFTGEGMLIRQGADSFKIWTGIYPDVKSALKLFNKMNGGMDA